MLASIQASARLRCCTWTAVSRGSGPGPPSPVGRAEADDRRRRPVRPAAAPRRVPSCRTARSAAGSSAAGGGHRVRRSARPPVGSTSSGRALVTRDQPVGGLRRRQHRLLAVPDQRGDVRRPVEQPVAVALRLQRDEVLQPAGRVGLPGARLGAAVPGQHLVAALHRLQLGDQRRVDGEAGARSVGGLEQPGQPALRADLASQVVVGEHALADQGRPGGEHHQGAELERLRDLFGDQWHEGPGPADGEQVAGLAARARPSGRSPSVAVPARGRRPVPSG